MFRSQTHTRLFLQRPAVHKEGFCILIVNKCENRGQPTALAEAGPSRRARPEPGPETTSAVLPRQRDQIREGGEKHPKLTWSNSRTLSIWIPRIMKSRTTHEVNISHVSDNSPATQTRTCRPLANHSPKPLNTSVILRVQTAPPSHPRNLISQVLIITFSLPKIHLATPCADASHISLR